MKVLFTSTILITGALLPACSAELKDSMVKEINEAKSFDYVDAFREITGLKKDFPNMWEKAKDVDNKLCLHEDSADRHVTANGINDKVIYRGCVLSPSLGNQNPQRMDGR